MKRFRLVLFFLILATPAFAAPDWEALVDGTGAVSMVHVPGSAEWIELVNEESGEPLPWGTTFHLEKRDWPLLPRSAAELAGSRPGVWKDAGVNIGKDYADHPEQEDRTTA